MERLQHIRSEATIQEDIVSKTVRKEFLMEMYKRDMLNKVSEEIDKVIPIVCKESYEEIYERKLFTHSTRVSLEFYICDIEWIENFGKLVREIKDKDLRDKFINLIVEKELPESLYEFKL